jgi:hypothetical protein
LRGWTILSAAYITVRGHHIVNTFRRYDRAGVGHNIVNIFRRRAWCRKTGSKGSTGSVMS